MADPALHPIAQVAKLVGITSRRLRILAKEDHIPQVKNGKVDMVRTVQGYCKYLRELGGESAADYHAERTRLTKLKADQAQLEVDRLAEEVFEADAVIALVEGIAAAARTHLLGVSGKLKANNPDVTVEICADIDAVIREALGALADENAPKDILKRLG